MTTLAKLVVKLTADVGKYVQGMGDAAKETDSVVARMGKGVQTIGKLAVGGIAAGVGAVAATMAKLGPQAINAASDFEESLSKVNVVFGDSAGVVEAFSRTTAWGLGVSQREALATAGTYGNLFVTMGVGQDAAAGMSTELVTLAADLASFNNLDTVEVLDKLRAGLVGEAEPLRALGVALTEDAVKAKAVEMGLAASTKEVSQAAKLQARFALIMEQTTTAQGDFARTSDGLANSQRMLGAVWQDVLQRAGQTLLPPLLKLLEKFKPVLMNDILPALEGGLTAFGNFVGALTNGESPLEAVKGLLRDLLPPDVASAVIGAIDGIVNGVQGIIQTVGPYVEQAATWIGQNVALQDVLMALGVAIAAVIIQALGSFIGAAALVIAAGVLLIAAVTAIRTAWENDFLGIRTFVETTLAQISAWWTANGEQIIAQAVATYETVRGWIEGAMATVGEIVSTVLTAIRTWWDEHGASVMTIVNAFVSWVSNAFRGFTTTISTIVKTVLGAIAAFWQEHGDAITEITTIAWDTIKTVVETILGGISTFIDAVALAISGDWEGFGKKLREIWDSTWKGIKEILSNAWEGIKTIVSELIESIKDKFTNTDWAALGKGIINGVVNGIKNNIQKIIDAVLGAIRAALDAAEGFFGGGSSGVNLNVSGMGSVPGVAAVRSGGLVAATGAGDMNVYGDVYLYGREGRSLLEELQAMA